VKIPEKAGEKLPLTIIFRFVCAPQKDQELLSSGSQAAA
jgi:hypothetical protein